MTWKEFLKDYLTFTRRDRIAILALLGLIAFIIFIPSFLKRANSKSLSNDSSWIVAVKKLQKKEEDLDSIGLITYQYDQDEHNEKKLIKAELFYFDPNTISKQEWQKLGLRDKIITTIQNYLKKGGHFYHSRDMQKIYGLTAEEYNRLHPYVKIENYKIEKPERNVSIPFPVKSSTVHFYSIDINTADTQAFISLPGIGNKLAARIISFRDKLGGFYSVNQIAEIYGLPDSTFQNIRQNLKMESCSIKKININTATLEELKAHPYIKMNLAKPIIAYRNEHGPFSGVEDLKKIMAISNESYTKILPYLVAQ
jgi:competence protein ComEA